MLLIHLSDIHFRKGEIGTTMDPNAHLRGELLRDARLQCERIGANPDAILVSGDVAFAGDPEESECLNQRSRNQMSANSHPVRIRAGRVRLALLAMPQN